MVTKIICAYHDGAPSKLHDFVVKHPGIFIPVLGGAIYYKRGSNPFYDSLIPDNTGENISQYIGHVNEHCPLYWAYKHYHEIGNPDMIGLCHYRRFFDVDYDHLDIDKIYASRVTARHAAGMAGMIADTIQSTYENFCGREIMELYTDAYRNALPDYKDYLDEVLGDTSYYAKNMFIMNRSNFQDFMDYVCRVLRVLYDDKIFEEAKSIYHPDMHIRRMMLTYSRCRGYLMEMFTAIWLERQYYLRKNIVSAPLLEFRSF